MAISPNPAGPHVTFTEWTRGRELLTVGTNSGSETLGFQGWRRFKESFAPEIIERAVSESCAATGKTIKTCIDPFGGSGTTALACQFLGIMPTTIEVNPYLADLIEAKLSNVDVRQAARAFSRMLQSADKVDPNEYYYDAPKTFVEPGHNGNYLFSYKIAERIASLSNHIETKCGGSIQRLLRVLLASAALEVCNATVSGKGRRYRRNWQTIQYDTIDLDRAYTRLFSLAIFDLSRYGDRKERSYNLLRGDAREQMDHVESVDLAVFSPPYPNSFDYTDVYNIELWMMRYLKSKSDNRELRNATLRSHVQIARDLTAAELESASLNDALSDLHNISGTLWNRNIPSMIGAYFADMNGILHKLRSKLNNQGRVYAIVGDSCYAQISIPVAKIITEIAPQIGYRVLSSEPFRSMRLSPQQGGNPKLSESMVILEAN